MELCYINYKQIQTGGSPILALRLWIRIKRKVPTPKAYLILSVSVTYTRRDVSYEIWGYVRIKTIGAYLLSIQLYLQ